MFYPIYNYLFSALETKYRNFIIKQWPLQKLSWINNNIPPLASSLLIAKVFLHFSSQNVSFVNIFCSILVSSFCSRLLWTHFKVKSIIPLELIYGIKSSIISVQNFCREEATNNRPNFRIYDISMINVLEKVKIYLQYRLKKIYSWRNCPQQRINLFNELQLMLGTECVKVFLSNSFVEKEYYLF